MSGTSPAPATPVPAPNTFANWLSAVELGASSIFHRVLKVESDVSAWIVGHPSLQGLLAEAITFVEGMVGVSPTVVTTAQAIMAMLGKLAQSDPTVTSGPSLSTAVQPPASGASA
jgi:hypothetical protein